jgi:geranylgeranyl pyrophosphate synthase
VNRLDNRLGPHLSVRRDNLPGKTLSIRNRRVTLQRTDVFGIMRADLDRVNARVAQVAQVDYPEASALVNDIVQAGGKRLRPLILLLSGRAFQYTAGFDRLITAAAGVELLHTASLIHDDTVDRSALRRGKPTLNSVLSAGATILIGDFLFAQSAMLAAATGSVRVVSIFAATLGDICDGQLREMFHGHRLDQTRDDYDARIYGKTASLFAGSAEMGAVLGEASEKQIQALRGYGADVGMAFQVIDDLLDITGQTQELGKPSGNDLREGTITLPSMLYAAQLDSDGPEMRRLQRVAAGHENGAGELADVVSAIKSSDAIDRTFAVAQAFVAQAKDRLIELPDPETRDLLSEVADFALARHS